MGMLISLNPVFISHIIQATFSEFEVDRHYYGSQNQKEEPSSTSFSRSERLPDNAKSWKALEQFCCQIVTVVRSFCCMGSSQKLSELLNFSNPTEYV